MKTVPDVITTINSSGKTLNLLVFLEGLYNGGATMRKAKNETGDQFPENIADQITIELHNALNYSEIVYSTTNVNLNTSGLSSITIPSHISGSYYITVRHRNSIETTTAVPVSLEGYAISCSFDVAYFVYGSNLKEINSKLCLYGGDVNQDGFVDTAVT
ncbi:MAG: hypothetical protein IPH20_15870 [Bacteroidales bacterium]|nr:hypothetical protein [Bacteroidales bacterium]